VKLHATRVEVVSFLEILPEESRVLAITSQLLQSDSRIVVFLGGFDSLSFLTNQTTLSGYEFVWIDPSMRPSSDRQISSYNLGKLGAFHVGFRPYDTQRIPSGMPASAAPFYDAMAIWANAVIGENSLNSKVAIRDRMRTQISPSTVEPFISFSGADRAGAVDIRNFNTTWRMVGVWNRTQPFSLHSTAVFSKGNSIPGPHTNLRSIPLGIILTNSPLGFWPSLVDGLLKTAVAAADFANQEPSLLKDRVQIVILDRKVPDSNSANIEAGISLKESGCTGFLGPIRSSHAVALQNYAGGKGYPQIGFSSTADVLSQKGNFPVRPTIRCIGFNRFSDLI
jgi:hypothetical protein